MSALLPAAVYGLEVPNGDVMVPALPDFPAAFRITMAAIDPTAAPEYSGTVADGSTPRATLKLVRQPLGPEADEDDSEYDSDEEQQLRALLNGELSEEEDESSDEETNGGPSDPAKSKKAREEAAIKALKEAAEASSEDEVDMDGANGILPKLDKGKGIATGSESDEDSELEVEEFVLCTLDPEKHYQQTLDLTVSEDERVYFKVTGTHAIYLTGNYVIPVDDTPREDDYDEEDEAYDLSPDEDELDSEAESDELDAIENPRITELESEEEETPKLVKGKNKRPAADSDDEPTNLDDLMSKSIKKEVNGEKLSKKQLKKLKNSAGQAVPAPTKEVKKESSSSADSPQSNKKVQFAKNLEQGPTGSKANTKNEKKDEKTNEKPVDHTSDKPKSTLGVKHVNGVTVDDKKLGSGRAAKKGDKIGMRYIGKLKDGKVFDANKKGKPFTFKLGAGEVIKGWDIGVEGITVGGERRIIIPAKLAYGNKSLPKIPANSDLTFDIKCLEIN